MPRPSDEARRRYAERRMPRVTIPPDDRYISVHEPVKRPKLTARQFLLYLRQQLRWWLSARFYRRPR